MITDEKQGIKQEAMKNRGEKNTHVTVNKQWLHKK
jgi:hypothetical protein